MMFFFGAASTVSFAVTDVWLERLMIDTYGLAFAGQYAPRMFFMEEDPSNEHSFSLEWVLRFLVYVSFGILIMVALNNIFIGIMGNAYDYHKEKVSCLLVRQRASVALDAALSARAMPWAREPGE